MDYAADELGVDPVELRRRNFIRPEQMPFKTAAGELYDTGEFARVMDTCLQKAGLGRDRRSARPQAKARGKLRGIGMCYYIESTMGDPSEHAAIEFGEDGTVAVHGRHPDQRPGPRHGLHPGAAPAAERAVREDPGRAGRHRPDQGRRRHRRLALADRAGRGDQRRGRPRDRARQGLRGAGVRDRRGRHPVRRRHVPGRGHRPGDRDHGARGQGADDGRRHGHGGRARRRRHHHAQRLDLPQRLPHRRGRGRSRHRHRAAWSTTTSSTISAWC